MDPTVVEKNSKVSPGVSLLEIARELKRSDTSALVCVFARALPANSKARSSDGRVLAICFKLAPDIRHICRIPAKIRTLYLSPLMPAGCTIFTVNAFGVSFLPVALRWLFPLEVLPSNLKGLRLCREPFFLFRDDRAVGRPHIFGDDPARGICEMPPLACLCKRASSI